MLTDWSEANSNCLRLGGHLVSIHSENENKIVYEAVKGYNVDVFIGLFVLDSGSKQLFYSEQWRAITARGNTGPG